jgi:hypothetical protein
VAHALLVTAYHVLARQTAYREPGVDYYDRRHTHASRAAPSTPSSAKASGSRWSAPPEREVEPSGDLLSKIPVSYFNSSPVRQFLTRPET